MSAGKAEILRQRYKRALEKAARERFAIPLLLILTVATVYSPVVGFEFLNFDDPLHIQDNPLVKDFSWVNLVDFWSRPFKGLYVPLTYTVWGLIGVLADGGSAGLSPLPFHLANLFLHIASTLLVYSLLRRGFSSPWGAAAGAIFFAVHPLQVEAVAWATGMKDLLAGFLSLTVLWSYQRYIDDASQMVSGRYRYYLLAGLGMAAALLAKPSTIMVPFLAGALAGMVQRRPLVKVVRELAPWLLLVVPVVYLTKGAQPDNYLNFVPTFAQRFLVAGDAVSFYLSKLLWPVGLAFDYGRTPEYVLAHGWVYLTGLLPYLVGLVLLCLAWRRGQIWPAVVAGMMVIPLLPVLGFVSFYFQAISTVADRYFYTAMLAPALTVCWLISRYRSRLVYLVVAGLLLVLAGLSVCQLESWRNSQTLAAKALLVNPDSLPANHNLGLWYSEHGRYDLALAHYRKVLRLAPEYPLIHLSLGELYLKLNRRDKAMASFIKALEITPDSGAALDQLAQIYAESGSAEESVIAYKKAIAVGYLDAVAHLADLQRRLAGDIVVLQGITSREPGNFDARWKLGALLNLTGRQQEALGVYRELAVTHPENPEAQHVLAKFFCELHLYDEAKTVYLRGRGDNAEAMADLEVGLICLELGRPADAVGLYQMAVTLRPGFAEAHANLGVALRQLGRNNEAMAAFRKALALDPSLTGVYLDLGHLLDFLGQEGEAVDLYRRAGEIDPASAIPAFALGRHWLEKGQFTEAQAALEKSLRADPGFVPSLASLAKLYRQTGRNELAAEYEKRALRLQYGGSGVVGETADP
jgi:tetratricopeptide (TPR) repeat protein